MPNDSRRVYDKLILCHIWYLNISYVKYINIHFYFDFFQFQNDPHYHAILPCLEHILKFRNHCWTHILESALCLFKESLFTHTITVHENIQTALCNFPKTLEAARVVKTMCFRSRQLVEWLGILFFNMPLICLYCCFLHRIHTLVNKRIDQLYCQSILTIIFFFNNKHSNIMIHVSNCLIVMTNKCVYTWGKRIHFLIRYIHLKDVHNNTQCHVQITIPVFRSIYMYKHNFEARY